MVDILDDEANDALKRAYSHLQNQLRDDRKLKRESVVATFLNLKANVRYDYLSGAALLTSKFPRNVIGVLEMAGLVGETDEVGKYALTCQGVLRAEAMAGGGGIDLVLQEIDARFFRDVYKGRNRAKPLRERYRLVLLSLIALRIYSRPAALRLNRVDEGGKVFELVRATIEELYDFMKQAGLITSDTVAETFGNSGVDHPVVNLFRHTDEVKRATRRLFVAVGDSAYCLDLVDGGKINLEKLAWLIWLIFRDQLSPELFNKFRSLSRKLAYDNAIHLYDDLSLSFASPGYDVVLSDAFSVYLKKRIAWESEFK